MSAWEILMGSGEDQSQGRGVRTLFAVMMLVGVCLAGYGLYRHFQYTEPAYGSSVKVGADADKQRLAKMTENLRATVAARQGSANSVVSSAMIARYPFGAPVVAPEANAGEAVPIQVAAIPDAELSDNYGNVPIDTMPSIVPPQIDVKGIVSLGKDTVAMLDIEGEQSGKIYRVGDTFAAKKGRITAITPKKISVTFSGKKFDFGN